MGRMLGAFADNTELDRPDLNKCPDCGCYFQQDACPLCGKICPEEMRAGNRKTVKPPKRKRSGGNGRVTFVEWYHSWWFILIMLVIFPLVGIILLFTSPHKVSRKIVLACIAGLYTVLISWGVLFQLFDRSEDLVDTSMSLQEMVLACEKLTPEQFYRSSAEYAEKYVTTTLTVSARLTEVEYDYRGNAQPIVYYLCTYGEQEEYQILIRDCRIEAVQNYVAGDQITVYGAGAGELTVYDGNDVPVSAPGIYAVYMERIESQSST